MNANLDHGVASSLFQIYSTQELARPDEQLQTTLDEMDKMFPDSAFLQTQRAVLLYHLKGCFERSTRCKVLMERRL